MLLSNKRYKLGHLKDFRVEDTGKVMRIQRLIYGIMQSGRNWWRTLDVSYKELGYSQSQADSSTQELGITFSRDAPGGITPITYIDADFAVDTCHSTSGILTMIAGGPTFWMSK